MRLWPLYVRNTIALLYYAYVVLSGLNHTEGSKRDVLDVFGINRPSNTIEKYGPFLISPPVKSLYPARY